MKVIYTRSEKCQAEQINIFKADSFPDQYLTPAQTDVYMYLESV